MAKIFICVLVLAISSVFAGGDIVLPQPDKTGGKPLMQVLSERKTSRSFDKAALSAKDLSNLMWAAFGVNRPETNGRTAPSAMNMQEIDVYAALAEGLFLYDAKTHTLKKISDKDIRAATGKQPFVASAPVNLIFVANFDKVKNGKTDDSRFYAAMDAGFISENVYLYCASANLATVVRGYVDRELLAKEMALTEKQEIILSQTVGYPGK
ncbi:MAG: SagB/ThcOx family dehydrogenase [Fibrobacteres bacterium]|nr:SagB/ThcOx family dehydrogenase [Fibrobacterota bacterium]